MLLGLFVTLFIFVLSQRPPPSKRSFNSSSIEKVISDLVPKMKDPQLAELFSNCFPNTLDTTVEYYAPRSETSPPDTFIITGDINAMWLRDSTNQVLPYIPYAKEDLHLRSMLCGLIHRQAKYIVKGMSLSFPCSYNFFLVHGASIIE